MTNEDIADIDLENLHDEYKSTNDPTLVFEALRRAWASNKPLPTWAFEILGHAAMKYMWSDGNTPFEEFVGIKHGKGRDNHPLKKRHNKEFRSEVAYRAAEANKRYGFTLPVTFWLLSQTGVDDQHLSSERIKEIYKTEDHDYYYDQSNDRSAFLTCSNRGYFEAIFSNEYKLKELGLYDSAIRTIQKMLKRGK